MARLLSCAAALLLGLLSTAAGAAGDVEQLLLGDHVMTLQWLQNHNGIGRAKISKQDGKIVIDGYQEEKYQGHHNYMSIEGTLRILDPKELEFDGTIVTRINYINGGAPYERKGRFLLKVTGKRKYWRMQNMTQPDTGYEVTDYIDIYFEKFP
jgi:hypothetical protein